jgi:hypothetical protein
MGLKTTPTPTITPREGTPNFVFHVEAENARSNSPIHRERSVIVSLQPWRTLADINQARELIQSGKCWTTTSKVLHRVNIVRYKRFIYPQTWIPSPAGLYTTGHLTMTLVRRTIATFPV